MFWTSFELTQNMLHLYDELLHTHIKDKNAIKYEECEAYFENPPYSTFSQPVSVAELKTLTKLEKEDVVLKL